MQSEGVAGVLRILRPGAVAMSGSKSPTAPLMLVT